MNAEEKRAKEIRLARAAENRRRENILHNALVAIATIRTATLGAADDHFQLEFAKSTAEGALQAYRASKQGG